MRIVLDLQAVQGADGSLVGQYGANLATALIHAARNHEVVVALNTAFGAESVQRVGTLFSNMLAADQIVTWEYPVGAAPAALEKSARLYREYFFQKLSADIVHTMQPSLEKKGTSSPVTSITSIRAATRNCLTAVSLVDTTILSDSRWNAELKRADLILCASARIRERAIGDLNLKAEKFVTVGAGRLKPFFKGIASVSPAEGAGPGGPPLRSRALRDSFGVRDGFVLCWSAQEEREGNEALLSAYAKARFAVRSKHQLVIFGHFSEDSHKSLVRIARQAGLLDDEWTLIRDVSETVFSELCGAARLILVPSLVQEFDGALFDALDPQRSAAQAEKHSWQATANEVLNAMENVVQTQRSASVRGSKICAQKPRLAMVSPLPPKRTGVAQYTIDLLEELRKYYHIELVGEPPAALPPMLRGTPVHSAESFAQVVREFDRIVYQFGNSSYHDFMYPLFADHPGVVVLHDFYLSGSRVSEPYGRGFPEFAIRSLYESHGYRAVLDQQSFGTPYVTWQYPCNLPVLRSAHGVIVHNSYPVKLAKNWYDEQGLAEFMVLPMVSQKVHSMDKVAARKRLGLDTDDFVVCSFGFMAEDKLLNVLYEAWFFSQLSHNPRCKLVFVGSGDGMPALNSLAHWTDSRVKVTGFTDDADYHDHLLAADVAVQLRSSFRGETSRAMLDCLVYGVPLIVNAHGAMAEVDDSVVVKLRENCNVQDVANALLKLFEDSTFRHALAKRAAQFVRENHSPEVVARRYFDAIEQFYGSNCSMRQSALRDFREAWDELPAEPILQDAVSRFLHTFDAPAQRVKLVDVTQALEWDRASIRLRNLREALRDEILSASNMVRVEPVYKIGSSYFFAHQFMRNLFHVQASMPDGPVCIAQDDVLDAMELMARFAATPRRA